MITESELRQILATEEKLEAAIVASEHANIQEVGDSRYAAAIALDSPTAIGVLAASCVVERELPARRDIASRWLRRYRLENSPALLEILDSRLQAAKAEADALQMTQAAALEAIGMEWTPNPKWEALNNAVSELGYVRHTIGIGEAGAAAILRILSQPQPSPASDESLAEADQVIERRRRSFARG